ncbi:DRD2 (predicted) [Pycnogonum litorale]
MEMFSTALNPSSTSNDTVDSQPEALASTEGSQSKKSNIPAFAIAMMTSNLRRRRREKSTAKRERKATKTLAIVLGVFLACWLPFFTCNVLTAICMKIDVTSCISGIELFMSTTWIGYINSCLNPIIYTVFNMEFRKAFKKLILQPCLKN